MTKNEAIKVLKDRWVYCDDEDDCRECEARKIAIALIEKCDEKKIKTVIIKMLNSWSGTDGLELEKILSKAIFEYLTKEEE